MTLNYVRGLDIHNGNILATHRQICVAGAGTEHINNNNIIIIIIINVFV